MSFYDEYKPFRNLVRRMDLANSLVDVWCYFLHIEDNKPLPREFAVGKPFGTQIKGKVWPWELATLAREIVLSAGKGGDRSLRLWKIFAESVDHIKRLDEAAYTYGISGTELDIFTELHRIAHLQFPWQMKVGINSLMRAIKVFGRSTMEAIVQRELGMSMRQFFLLGMAVAGYFKGQPILSTTQEYDEALGISHDASRAFFEHITSTSGDLRTETANQQSYDADWRYTWNPLEAKPLVRFDPAQPDRVVCPIPDYLLRRTSAGVFYDLVTSSDFDNPYGDSFQAYVGEVIQAVCKPPGFTIIPEEPYYVGSDKFHGVDWLLSDETGHLFVEAKTKRLTLNARIRTDDIALDKDLKTMASAIVQHYQNILRARDGKTRWVPDNLPIYPIILTLEDWFIFSPRVSEKLNVHIKRLLEEHTISESVLTDMPFTVSSAQEFETAVQVIAKVGIDAVMSKKTAVERWNWSLFPFLTENFGEEMKGVNWHLFGQEFLELLPEKARR
jgi:hypothetical protein